MGKQSTAAKSVVVLLASLLLAASPATNPTTQPRRLKSDVPDAVRKTWESKDDRKAKSVAAAKELLAKEKKRIELMKAGKVDRKEVGVLLTPRPDGLYAYTFPTPEEKQKQIESQQEDIKKAEARVNELSASEFVPESANKVSELVQDFIGNVGAVTTKQVVDDNSAIVTVSKSFQGFKASRRAEHGVLRTTETEQIDLYIEGFDMSKSIDGRGASIGTVWIDGTKRFRTASGGERTILKAVPFNIGDWLEQE